MSVARPKLNATTDPPLRASYHVPVPGRNTARSDLPSPSKSPGLRPPPGGPVTTCAYDGFWVSPNPSLTSTLIVHAWFAPTLTGAVHVVLASAAFVKPPLFGRPG